MKILAHNNKKKIIISKSEWINIGKKFGWISKEASSEHDVLDLIRTYNIKDQRIIHALYICKDKIADFINTFGDFRSYDSLLDFLHAAILTRNIAGITVENIVQIASSSGKINFAKNLIKNNPSITLEELLNKIKVYHG